jgi:glutathione synthase/RimK-type ligase-like ATP-grasp enzyme
LIAIISNAADVTADFLEGRIRKRGKRVVRINTEDLARLQVNFSLETSRVDASFLLHGTHHRFRDLTAIYYRRPKLPDVAAELDGGLRSWVQNELRRVWGGLLLATAEAKWINHPNAITSANYKPEQLCRARNMGLLVPDTIITNVPSSAMQFCQSHGWNVVVKPVGHGEIQADCEESDRLVYTSLLGESQRQELALVANCPTLFQAHIKKQLDIRATVVDGSCVSVALHSQEQPASAVDCRRENMRGMRYSLFDLPEDLAQRLIALTRSYRLHFAAIDLALDPTGRYWFLELNPAGQWAWLEEITKAPISDALIDSLSR